MGVWYHAQAAGRMISDSLQVQVLHAGIIALVDGRLAIYCAMARAQTPSLRVGLDKGFHEHGLMR